MRMWQVAKRERLAGGDLPAHQEAVSDLVFSPDRKILVTGDRRGEIKIWDLAKREAVHTIQGHSHQVVAFAMSPDGSRFVTAGLDNVVKLWETSTGKELRKWDLRVPPLADKSFVCNLAFAPDGKHVATANANTTVYLLELP